RRFVGRLCQLRKLSEFTEGSRGDASDMDGQPVRASERGRMSQTPLQSLRKNRRFLNFARRPCGRSRRLSRNTRGMKKKVTRQDLKKDAPRSPRIRGGGYAILARTIAKCRALAAGNTGDCPMARPPANTPV